MMATSAPMIVWTLGGLEGVLFSTLCSLGVMAFWRATRLNLNSRLLLASGVLFALAALTRPDGIVFAFVSFLFIIFLGSDKRVRAAGAFLVPFTLILLPYLIWAATYYGDVLPNAFYVKAAGFSILRVKAGALYLGQFALVPPYGLILLILAVGYAGGTKRLQTPIVYLVSCIVSYLLFIGYVGGDHMQCFRLMLPTIPLTAYAVYLVLREAVSPKDGLAIFVIYCLVFTLSLTQLFSIRLNPREEDPAARVGTAVGKYIATYWPKGSLVALNTAGSTPYYASQLRFIDMLGINDRHIAKRHIGNFVLPWQSVPGHSKGDGGYVLSREPDFIIVGPSEGTRIDRPWFLSDLEMLDDPRFRDHYVMHEVVIDENGAPTQEGLLFTYYQRLAR